MREQETESAEKLVEYLEAQDEAYMIRQHKTTVDFTIGEVDLWPANFDDSELNVVRGSSISFGGIGTPDGKASRGDPRLGSNIHFPPGPADLWNELEDAADLPGPFALVNGSFKLGSLLPPPDGVCTPHVILTDDATVDEVTTMLDDVFELYQSVYDGGAEIIKKRPNACDGSATEECR